MNKKDLMKEVNASDTTMFEPMDRKILIKQCQAYFDRIAKKVVVTDDNLEDIFAIYARLRDMFELKQ